MKLKFERRLIIKGAIVVPLSAIASFVAAVLSRYTSAVDVLAMLCGVATFILIHIVLEAWAVANSYSKFQRSLYRAVLTKMVLQIVPIVELLVGVLASSLVNLLGIKEKFVVTYLTTVVCGTGLTLVVFLITFIYLSVGRLTRPAAGGAA